MHPIRRISLLVLLMVTIPAVALAQSGSRAGQTFEKSELWIETKPGQRFHFDVELALTPAQQAQGLMYRESLAPDAGMLFIFPEVRRLSFWMKNTLIPLDMLFIDADGEIINIHKRTKPRDLSSYPAAAPGLAVLEINGGVSDLLGIAPGDRVIHEAFGNNGPGNNGSVVN